MSAEGRAAAQQKMRDRGVHQAAIDVFLHYYEQLESGATGLIHESDIRPLEDPPRLAHLPGDEAKDRAALAATTVIKLNGGLGTSMGMAGPKSLLEVREGLTFLDIIARQVLAARQRWDVSLPVLFMNSFRTRDETLEALAAYDDLAVEGLPMDFMQHREPKLLADDLTPVDWPREPELEWCPPGHGDLYTALSASGLLQLLRDAGYRYAFVSNSDNLRATVDARVAGWFASSGAPFASEITLRTPADRKGGHLAVRVDDGRLVLRETAQTSPEDADALADISRHRYCNTNNLWLDLDALATKLEETQGFLGLPLIKNEKTVDPGDRSSPKVIQIESAMGAAVEVFEGSQALEVERTRFLPVKSTNDLLGLRSDVYQLADGCELRYADGVDEPPLVDLDDDFYKIVGDFDKRFPHGPPSLRDARSFTVEGDWTFGPDVVVRGDVTVDTEGSPGTISATTLSG
ncbi:MAG TPA: UTP--glucose-1-phosphate uridylyltransferase [Nocardioidaceae bacterium]|jgi:UTP--glucose-1-phosphate uridylyltransferase